MAGLVGVPARKRAGYPVPAIHVFSACCADAFAWMRAQASLRSLRKLDCKPGHDRREV